MTQELANPPSLWNWAEELLTLPKVISARFRKPDHFESFGNERPALVLPGMFSGDQSTALLRASLDQAGFASSGTHQRANVIVSEQLVIEVGDLLKELVDRADKKALLIGWSLGGLIARVLAHRMPEQVEVLVTMGSPFSGNRRSKNAWRYYEWHHGHSVDAPPFPEDISEKPSVRTLAIWSKRDGNCSSRICRWDKRPIGPTY